MRSLLLILFFLPACSTSPRKTGAPKNDVFVLGTLHGYMLRHPHYTLKEFVGAIETYHPDLVLNEVRPERAGAAQGSIDGGIEQSIIYAYAELKGIPVVPVDWFDDAYIAGTKIEDSQLSEGAKTKIRPLEDEYERSFKSATFAQLQSPSTQEVVRKMYGAYEEAGLTLSKARNEHICENIARALQGLDRKRVLIVFGLDHKYFQEDCARQLGNNIEQASEIFDLDKLSQFKVPGDLRDRSVANMKASAALLKAQLNNGFYKGALQEKLRVKLNDYAKWIEITSKL